MAPCVVKFCRRQSKMQAITLCLLLLPVAIRAVPCTGKLSTAIGIPSLYRQVVNHYWYAFPVSVSRQPLLVYCPRRALYR